MKPNSQHRVLVVRFSRMACGLSLLAVLCLTSVGCGKSKKEQMLEAMKRRQGRQQGAQKKDEQKGAAEKPASEKTESSEGSVDENAAAQNTETPAQPTDNPGAEIAEKDEGQTVAGATANSNPEQEDQETSGQAPPNSIAGSDSEPASDTPEVAQSNDVESTGEDNALATEITGDFQLPTRNRALTLSQDGTAAIQVGDEGVIGVYDVATQRLIRTAYCPDLVPYSVALGEDRKHLVVGGVNGSLKIFSLDGVRGIDKFEVLKFMRADSAKPRTVSSGIVSAVAVSDSRGLVFTGSDRGRVQVWSLADSEEQSVELAPASEPISLLVTGKGDFSVVALTESGKLVRWPASSTRSRPIEFANLTGRGTITCLSAGPGGLGAAVGLSSGEVVVFQPEGSGVSQEEFKVSNSPIASIAFSENGSSIKTLAQDGALKTSPWPQNVKGEISLSEPAKFLVSSASGNVIGAPVGTSGLEVYDRKTGDRIRSYQVAGQLVSAELYAGGSNIALGDDAGNVTLQDSSQKPLAKLSLGRSPIAKLERLSGGRMYFEADGYGVLQLPTLGARKIAGQLTIAAVSPDQKTAIGFGGGQLFAAPIEEPQRARQVALNAQVSALAMTGNVVLAGTADGGVWAWDLNNAPNKIGSPNAGSAIVAIADQGNGKAWCVNKQGQVFEVGPGEPEARVLMNLGNRVEQLAVAKGSVLASVGKRIIHFRGRSDQIKTIDCPGGRVVCLHVSDQGQVSLADDQGAAYATDESGSLQAINVSAKGARTVQPAGGREAFGVVAGRVLLIAEPKNPAVQLRALLPDPQCKLLMLTKSRAVYLDSQQNLFEQHIPELLWKSEEVSIQDSVVSSGNIWVATKDSRVLRVDASSGQTRSVVEAAVKNLTSEGESVWALADDGRLLELGTSSVRSEFSVKSNSDLVAIVAQSPGQPILALNSFGELLAWDVGNDSVELIDGEQKVTSFERLGSGQVLACSSDSPAKLFQVGASDSKQQATKLEGNFQLVNSSPLKHVVDVQDTTVKIYPVSNAEANAAQPIDVQLEGVKVLAAEVCESQSRLVGLAENLDTQDFELLGWELAGGSRLYSQKLPGRPSLLTLTDAGVCAFAIDETSIEIRSTRTGDKLASFSVNSNARHLAFDASGQLLFVGQESGSVQTFGFEASPEYKWDGGAVVALQVLEKRKQLLAVSAGGRVATWDLDNPNSDPTYYVGASAQLTSNAVSPDGRYLLATFDDKEKTSLMWELAAGGKAGGVVKPKAKLKNSLVPTAASFSADGKHVITGGPRGLIRALRLKDWREVAYFEGHRGPIESLSLLGGGSTIVSCGVDSSIRTWEFPERPFVEGRGVPETQHKQMARVSPLEKPSQAMGISAEDPADLARQAIVAGQDAGTAMELLELEPDGKAALLQGYQQLLAAEQNAEGDPVSLSSARRKFAALRQAVKSGDGSAIASLSNSSNRIFEAETNFEFPKRDERKVALRFAGPILYAGRAAIVEKIDDERRQPDEPVIKGDNGAVLSWDFRYSHLQTHAWPIKDLELEEVFALPNNAGVLLLPGMSLLSQDGTLKQLEGARSWDAPLVSRGTKQLLAVGTLGANRSESDLLRVLDLNRFSKDSVNPLSAYRGYEGVVMAVAFANQRPYVAFSVRERFVHRVFVADTQTLKVQLIHEEKHDKAWFRDELGNVTGGAAPGIESLAFSPDDRKLVGHGQFESRLWKFKAWELSWNENGELARHKEAFEETSNQDALFQTTQGQKSIWFVSKRSLAAMSSRGGSSDKLLVRVKTGFAVIDLKEREAERVIEFPAAQKGAPEFAVSKNGRWLLMGSDSGVAEIWDTLSGEKYPLALASQQEAALSAHSGPIVGAAFSEPDAGQDFPAFAATIGEENRVKVWELSSVLGKNRSRFRTAAVEKKR